VNSNFIYRERKIVVAIQKPYYVLVQEYLPTRIKSGKAYELAELHKLHLKIK